MTTFQTVTDYNRQQNLKDHLGTRNSGGVGCLCNIFYVVNLSKHLPFASLENQTEGLLMIRAKLSPKNALKVGLVKQEKSIK